MPADRAGPDKLSIIVFSGAFDRVHYALVTASAAVATNIPVTLFFTMAASRALLRPAADGTPGWHHLSPGEDGAPPRDMDAGFAQRGIATFDDLLDACVLLGVRFMVCEMGLKALDIDPGDLRPDVPVTPGGMVTFLADASRDGGLLFV